MYGTIDDGGYNPREFYSDGMYRGMVSHILAQGGDGIYHFNYYFGDYANNGYKIKPTESGQVNRVRSPKLLEELGSLETIKNRNKIYCASDGVTDSYRVPQVGDLPLAVGTGHKGIATIYVGDNVNETSPKESIIFIRTDRPAAFDLTVNGVKVTDVRPEYPKYYDRTLGLKEKDQVYAYVLPQGVLKQGYNEVSLLTTLASEGRFFVVKRLEIALKYGEVETNGYF